MDSLLLSDVDTLEWLSDSLSERLVDCAVFSDVD